MKTLTYCGHSTIILLSKSGKRIVIDPWFTGNPSCPSHLLNPGKFDLIVLTHGHSDHCGSVLQVAKESGATVCAVFELAVLLAKDGVPESQLQFMNKGGSVVLSELDGLRVTFTHAFHSNSYDAKDGKTYYAGEPCGVVLQFASGKSMYHAGDTALFSDMKLIRELYQPETVCLPIGDRFTMGPREAAKAVEYLQPKTVVPIHYATFPALSGTADDFANAVGKSSAKIAALKPGESLDL